MGIDKIYQEGKTLYFYMVCSTGRIFQFLLLLYAGNFYGALCCVPLSLNSFRTVHLKNISKWLGVFAVYSVIAVLIAAVVLLPVILPVFGTDRFKAENYVPLFYDRIYYEKYLGCLIGENMIQWGVAGYSAVSLAGVFVLYSQKERSTEL